MKLSNKLSASFSLRAVIFITLFIVFAGASTVLIKPAAVIAINGYQKYVSPHKGFSCAYHAFYPGSTSCSEYAKRAIDQVGVIRGYYELQKRLQQCREAYIALQTIALEAKSLATKGQVSDECSEACDNSCKRPCSDFLLGFKQVILQVLHDLVEDIRNYFINLANELVQATRDVLRETVQWIKEYFSKLIGSPLPVLSSQIKQDLPFAYMSECAYSNERCQPYLPKKLPQSGWNQLAPVPIMLGSSAEYTLFNNNEEERMVVAFRGTELNSLEDWVNNMGSSAVARLLDMSVPNLCMSIKVVDCINLVGPVIRAREQEAYKKEVERFAVNMVRQFGQDKIIFSGHSKGGGEALWASKTTGAQAVVFNPRSEFGTGDIYHSGQARGYYLEGEILHYGRFRDRKELVKIPYDDDKASPVARHEMIHMIKGMEAAANNSQ